MYQMITTKPDGTIRDIQRGEKAYFWNKNGQMTLNISRWVYKCIMQGYTISFEIC